jgi:hypothetical protein
MPALPSMTANLPPPLRAASASASSAATWASRSRSNIAVPPVRRKLAGAITTNPKNPQNHSLGAPLGLPQGEAAASESSLYDEMVACPRRPHGLPEL